MRKSIKSAVIWLAILVIGLPLGLTFAAFVTIQILDDSNGAIVSSGQEREFLIHVGQGYHATVPSALVLSMHGAATWPAQQMNMSGWNDVADEHGFIVVYPAGSGIPKVWQAMRPGEELMRDVAFFADLIESLVATYNIDAQRIYANGMSNGAGMAYVLGCLMPEKIAAIGMVASAQLLEPNWCESKHPVPMIVFHGTADPIVPYGGGRLGDPFNPVKPVFGPVREWVQGWASRNECLPEPLGASPWQDVTRIEYLQCSNRASVVLYSIRGAGHTWPGGKPLPEWYAGITSDRIKATRLMWEFFTKHPLVRD